MIKRLIGGAVIAFSFASSVFADDYSFSRGSEVNFEPYVVGFYLGVSGGYGVTHWKNLSGMIDVDINKHKAEIKSDTGFISRIFLGCDFSRYFAIEFGYTHFFNKVKFEDVDSKDVNGVRTQVLDLLGKGKLPLMDKMDLYGKFGIDYLISKYDTGSIYSTPVKNDNGNLALAYGVGVDYKFTPNFVLNFEWLRFNGEIKLLRDNKLTYQPYADAFLLGLRYVFDI